MIRTFAVGALLLVLPFGGIRVICVEAPADPSGSAASQNEQPLSDCERMCPFHPPAETSSVTAHSSDSGDGSDCALSSDGSGLSIVATVAVVRPHQPLQVPVTVSLVIAEAPQLYAEPALALLGPPPKPQAL
jgi:hypothetical protein